MKIINIFLGSAILLSFIALIGCQNTVQGMGKDMQNAGQKIEKSSE